MRERDHSILVEADSVTIKTTKETVERLMVYLSHIRGENFFKSSVWTLLYDLLHENQLKSSENVEILAPTISSNNVK